MTHPIMASLLPFLDKDKVDYAIMINGKWGSGKTHFLKRELKHEFSRLRKGRKEIHVLYSSANGIRTFEEIASQLIINNGLDKISKNRRFNKILAFGQRLLKDQFPVVKNVSSVELLEFVFDKNAPIIIIDDLERVDKDCDLIGLFGQINTALVEHRQIKVILVGDELELKKRFSTDSQETANDSDVQIQSEDGRLLGGTKSNYLNAKEKLVRYTFDFQNNRTVIIDKLIKDNIRIAWLVEVIPDYQEQIRELLLDRDISNLRIIQRYLTGLNDLLFCMEGYRDKLKFVFEEFISSCLGYLMDLYNLKAESKARIRIWPWSVEVDTAKAYIQSGRAIIDTHLEKEILAAYERAEKLTPEQKELNRLTFSYVDQLSNSEYFDLYDSVKNNLNNGKYNLYDISRFMSWIKLEIDNGIITNVTHDIIIEKLEEWLSKVKSHPLEYYDNRRIENYIKGGEKSEYASIINQLKEMVIEHNRSLTSSTIDQSLQNVLKTGTFVEGASELSQWLMQLNISQLDPIFDKYVEDYAFQMELIREVEGLSPYNKNQKPILNSLKEVYKRIESKLIEKGPIIGPNKQRLLRLKGAINEHIKDYGDGLVDEIG